MKIRWRMDVGDSVNYIYDVVQRMHSDLGEEVVCEADLDNPNLLALTSGESIYEPECYTYVAAGGYFEVYAWNWVK